MRARECAIFHREGVSNRLYLSLFLGFFKYLAVFFKSILLGYVCHAFKYFAVFFKSIEIFCSHYSSVFTVPFLRIVRLKDYPPVALHAMYYTRTVFLSTDTLITVRSTVD